MSEELLKTTKRAKMACNLLIAFETIRAIESVDRPVITRSEVIRVVLSPFKMGAAHAFLESLEDLKALDYRQGLKGQRMKGGLFSLTINAEKKMREELKELADLLIQLFPPKRPT